jgi:S1-C subfamily serine protease
MKRSYLFPLGSALVLALVVVGAYTAPRPHAPESITEAPPSEDASSTPTETASSTPAEAAPSAAELAAAGAAPAAAPVVPSGNLTAAGGTLLKATVNILCISRSGSGLKSISGSGVIIDSRGLILTAAHIGQYFLIADYKPAELSCVIRTGGPAEDAYHAEPVYVSPAWVKENSETISESMPKGTGENDFAVLAITGSATHATLPASFTAVPLGSETPAVGEKAAISGYAAQYLGSKAVENGLYPTIVFDAISDRYTFGGNVVDLISIGGTAAAQEGSSGGGVADEHGTLIGMITTSSIKGDISAHVLNAITPRHIRASFAADGGANFDSYFADNSLSTLVSNFKSQGRTLAELLLGAND